jgi:uracil-DNA glycosylase
MFEPLRDRFRAEAAKGDMPIDLDVYTAAGRDPLEPILTGSGRLDASLSIFGRDPGRTEVELAEPFIGKGGQLIRGALYRARHGTVPPDVQASIAVGRDVFWCNTVPYKPVGNKAWSVKIKRRFAPMVQDLLAHHFSGSDIICCGNVAFQWFGMVDKALKPALDAHWQLADRYERPLPIEFAGRHLCLHPLPHPSPLNARWYPLFPALMDACLVRVGWA